MREKSCVVALLVLMLAVFPLAMVAQKDPAPEGIEAGGYNIQQSIEFGYRFTDITTPSGNGRYATDDPSLFNTFVNLQQGPRLLEQTLSMRSLANTGVLFDNLYINSFGWGGDPNNVARVRVSKNKWYNFSGSFRRDQNYYDYNLLANPMNNPLTGAGTTSAILALPVNFSPHEMAVTRRMADLNLTLLPQSKFSVRMGYSRNRADGPSLTTNHEAGDTLMVQPWNTTYQTWNFGFDMKFIPKTNISFDQFLQYGKQDTDTLLDPSTGLGSFATYPLVTPAGGFTAAELGLIPTASCITATGNVKNTGCSAYLGYDRYQRVRTSTPTSQLSIQSHPSKWFDLTGRFSYSSMDMTNVYNEAFNGLVTRTGEAGWTINGPMKSQIITSSGDFGVTFHLTDKLDLSNTFRFLNERSPSTSNFAENILYFNSGVTASLTGCYTNPSSCYWNNPALDSDFLESYLKQNLKWNTTELTYQFNRVFGARVGYRYGNKVINYNVPSERGFESWDITEHTGLFGVWVRPNTKFRANFELELMSNNGVDVRIAPRNQQHYRFRTNYQPAKELLLSGTVNILENRNSMAEINYRGHNHNYGFTATINPESKVSIDLSYNYNQYMQNSYMCFVDTVTTQEAATGFVAPGTASACPTWSPVAANRYIYTSPNYTWSGANPADRYIYDVFEDTNHSGSFLVRMQPVKRVRANLGYSFTVVDGASPVFNMAVPLGALRYTYHQPLASIAVEMAKNWTFNTYWNYDNYKEGNSAFYSGVNPWGPTEPRYFHDNRYVLSVKYAF